MQAEIINTGSELLLGLVQNTHLAWLAAELAPLGISVERQVCVPDGPPVREALEQALDRADIVIVTGGLGPTSDDITRDAAAELLGRPLQTSGEILRALRERFALRNLPMTANNERQALIPLGAQALKNHFGSAPGLYFPPETLAPRRAQHLILLPGPPRELHPMMRESVLPLLHSVRGGGNGAECRIYRMTGIGESQVEARIGAQIEKRGDIHVGYCARPAQVDFRLIGPTHTLDEVEPDILAEVGEWIYSRDVTLEASIVNLLRTRQATLATAESCTGGALANRITDVPGASEVFLAGHVTYSNEAKVSAVGVPPDLIAEHGAVSGQVAAAMAEGARRKSGAEYALSTTGIAGPGGGCKEKPVGTVFIALAAGSRETFVRHCFFPLDRRTFKHMAVSAALDLLRRQVLDLPLDPGNGSAMPRLG